MVVVAVDVVADLEVDAAVVVALAAGTVAEVCTTKFACRHYKKEHTFISLAYAYVLTAVLRRADSFMYEYHV